MKKFMFLLTTLLVSTVVYSQVTTSPNMGLPVPQVGVTPGPAWATDINNSLNIIDAHDHTPGNGVPITPSAMNITSDLPFNNNNATLLRSTRYQVQSSPLSGGSDLGATYVSGVDLYYNDGNGNQVRITQGGSVTGATGSITGLVSPASASYSSGTETFVWQSDVNKAANMDARSYVLRNATTSSNGLTLSAPSLTSDYSLILPLLPAATNFMLLDVSGNITAPWHLDNATIGVVSNIIKVLDQGITATQIANNTITTNQISNTAGITLAQLSAAILINHTQTISTTGSFVVPSDVTIMHATCVGAGAGGGGGASPTANGGGGGSGGAGAYPLSLDLTVTPGQTLTITTGAGGSGATAATHNVNGNNGSAGTDTTITGTGIAVLCPGSNGVGIGGTIANSGASTGGAGTYGTSVAGSITGSAGGNSATAFNTTGSSGQASVWASVGAIGGTGGGTNNNSGRGGGGGGAGMCKGGAAGNGGFNGVTGTTGTAPVAPCYGAGGGGGGGSGASVALTGTTGGAGLGGAVILSYASHN